MTLAIQVEPHPLIRAVAFTTDLAAVHPDLSSPAWLVDLLRLDASSPFEHDGRVRASVRDALRIDGYKPTGRGKPASEYLARAADQGVLASINLPVDACNVVSLHSGIPISVIDLDRASPPFRIAVAGQDDAYVFNPSGQSIRLGGLPCLFDAAGPCANAVRDAQRTKTRPATRQTLSVLWGCSPLEDRTAAALAWYLEILQRAGATTRMVDRVAHLGSER